MKNIFHLFLILIIFFGCRPDSRQDTAVIDFPPAGEPPAWSRQATIYEVNLRQYTREGTIRAFIPHLPRLKALGIDILWLMPVHPIGEQNRKGSLGSPYAVKDYLAINPDLGPLTDLQQLVAEAHKLNMYVILDWVANHTAWDNPLTRTHPEWYKRNEQGEFTPPVPDWSDVIQLNYDHPGLRQYMIEAMKYWVQTADVDGFRCDVAMMVPTSFWEEARAALDSLKPVFMLAEAEVPEHLDYAFDMYYGWELHHIMNEIAAGRQRATDLVAYLQKSDTLFPPDAYRMNFITNHDENSWNGTIAERLGPAAGAMAVLAGTLPGMPLIYSGQEAGLDKRLAFFEKDTINWQDTSRYAFYRTLLHLKKNNRALWNGTSGGNLQLLDTDAPDNILAFTRQQGGQRLLAVFNLSPQPVAFRFRTPPDTTRMFRVMASPGITQIPAGGQPLPEWSFIIYSSKP